MRCHRCWIYFVFFCVSLFLFGLHAQLGNISVEMKIDQSQSAKYHFCCVVFDEFTSIWSFVGFNLMKFLIISLSLSLSVFSFCGPLQMSEKNRRAKTKIPPPDVLIWLPWFRSNPISTIYSKTESGSFFLFISFHFVLKSKHKFRFENFILTVCWFLCLCLFVWLWLATFYLNLYF